MRDLKRWILVILLTILIMPMMFGEQSMTEQEFNQLILNQLIVENPLECGFVQGENDQRLLAFSFQAWIELNMRAEAEMRGRAEQAVKIAVIPLKAELAAKDAQLAEKVGTLIGVGFATGLGGMVIGGAITAIIIAVVN